MPGQAYFTFQAGSAEIRARGTLVLKRLGGGLLGVKQHLVKGIDPQRHHGKGGNHLLFLSTTSTLSQTFRHLFVTTRLLATTRLLLDEVYQLIEVPFN